MVNDLDRAVATGAAGSAAAGPIFERIHEFFPTIFQQSIIRRTKQLT